MTNAARYLGAAIGVTVIAVLAAHPGVADMLAGWNAATLVNGAISVAGAAAVLACRDARRPWSRRGAVMTWPRPQ